MNVEWDYAMGLTAGRNIDYLERLDVADQYLENRARVCERILESFPVGAVGIMTACKLQNVRDAQRWIQRDRQIYLAETARRIMSREPVEHRLAADNG